MPESESYPYINYPIQHLLDRVHQSDYQFFEDSPFNFFDYYKIFAEKFPDALFILSVREVGEWFASVLHWNHKLNYPRIYPYLYGCEMIEANQKQITQRYLERNDEIIQYFDSQRLLVMNMAQGDGWEKLCPFLKIDVIDKPFFHENRSR